MSGYSDKGLYIPATYEELEQRRYNAYNTLLLSYNIPAISYEQYKTCNIKIGFETSQEIDLQNENNSGLLYTEILQYLINSYDKLLMQPYGCTTLGLTNALMKLDNVVAVSIDEPSRPNSTIDFANVEVALDTTGTIDTDQFFTSMITNLGCGIKSIGTNEVSGSDSNGALRVYYYSSFTNTPLQVRLFYTFDNNYYGNRLKNTDIVELYIEHFKTIYKAGFDILPAKMNDISFYPSLAYLNSQFSIDNGTTWLPLNEILSSLFNQKYDLDESTIIAEIE